MGRKARLLLEHIPTCVPQVWAKQWPCLTWKATRTPEQSCQTSGCAAIRYPLQHSVHFTLSSLCLLIDTSFPWHMHMGWSRAERINVHAPVFWHTTGIAPFILLLLHGPYQTPCCMHAVARLLGGGWALADARGGDPHRPGALPGAPGAQRRGAPAAAVLGALEQREALHRPRHQVRARASLRPPASHAMSAARIAACTPCALRCHACMRRASLPTSCGCQTPQKEYRSTWCRSCFAAAA